MIKIITVIGARPQFIKAAAISRAIKNSFKNDIDEVLLHTGQHYDANMSNVFFEELEIPKENYNLNIGSGSHAFQTGTMMMKIEEIVLTEKPDAILLYGDTNSTLAATLVAIKLHIPIIHVEAGVRSYNKSFPEEVNRLICDHMSSLLFVPSDSGITSLNNEGFKSEKNNNDLVSPDSPKVFRCGDIMYDNTLYFKGRVGKLKADFFDKHNIPQQDYILATIHRPSNVDAYDTLESIFKAFSSVVEKHNKSIILPLHPRTKSILEKHTGLKKYIDNKRIHIIPAVSFLEMILLEKYADLIITDSGGVQKEAYFMDKPCLIMLEETPWYELVDTGSALLVGNDTKKIADGVAYFLDGKKELVFPSLYGDGDAASFICEQILKYIKKR